MTTQTAISHVEKIADLLGSCRDEAVSQGAEAASYCPTAADLEWVTDRLGSKPSKEIWLEAAEIAGIEMKWVGEAHCSEAA